MLGVTQRRREVPSDCSVHQRRDPCGVAKLGTYPATGDPAHEPPRADGVLQRETPVAAGTEDGNGLSRPRRGPQPGEHRRKVDERADNHVRGASRPCQRGCPVRRRHHDGLPAHDVCRERTRGVSEVKTGYRLHLPLAGGEHFAPFQRAGARDRLLHALERDYRPGAVGEGRRNGGRGSQYVDHQHHAVMQVALAAGTTVEMDVDPQLPRFPEQPRLALEKLRVHRSALERLMRQHAAEERGGGGHSLDDK